MLTSAKSFRSAERILREISLGLKCIPYLVVLSAVAAAIIVALDTLVSISESLGLIGAVDFLITLMALCVIFPKTTSRILRRITQRNKT